MNRHIRGTDNPALPVNRSENMSENTSASDVNLNIFFSHSCG